MPLPVFPWCTTFGAFSANPGNTAETFKMFPVFQFPEHIFAMFPGFAENAPKVVHRGNTGRGILNEPLGNTTGTFFGKFQGFPMDYLIRTLWSHDQGNCKCTEHFPSMSYSGILYVLSLGKFKVYPQIT